MKNKFIIWAMTLNILSVIGIGFGIAHIREVTNPDENERIWLAMMVFIAVLTLILGQKVQVFFHELGHLIGGILTGLGRARDKTALPVFIANLRAEALLQTGVPVGDLPTALFDPLTTSNMTNSIHHVSLAAQKSAQLLDNERFTEAKEIILNLNTYEEIKLPIQAEHLLLELITTTDQDIIQQLYTDELKNFLATISTHENQKVSVFRLLYACARLIDKDDAKAQEYLTLFEIACKNSIVFGAIPAAKKIIALVDKLADEQMA